MSSLLGSVIVPHTPRMGDQPKAPDFVRGLIDGLRETGEEIRALKPDVLVLNTAHWVTTFNWYITSHERHRGRCIADEAPDIFPAIAYDTPGDPAMARAMAEEIGATGCPAIAQDVAEFKWDYGAGVPLKYLDPEGTIPVVLVGTCLMADLDECMAAGAAVVRAAEKLGRSLVFVSSSALSHALVRGPDTWPTPERKAMDENFVRLLAEGRVAEAREGFPEFARDGVVEMGGRVVAMMLGTLDESTASYSGRQVGAYCQSSASGNASIMVQAG